jgi:hypothetical protein
VLANEPHKAFGKSFKGAIAYCLEGHKDRLNPDRCAWTHVRNLPSDDPDLVAKMMRATAHRSVRCTEPVYHFSIDWAPNETPTQEQALDAAERILDRLGLSEHQVALFAHSPETDSTNHYHVHVVVNRIPLEEGPAWEKWKSKERLERATAEVAKEMGFEVVPGRHNRLLDEEVESLDPRPSKGEYQRARREGEKPMVAWSKERVGEMRASLAEAFREAASWDDLQQRLADHGVELQPKGQGLIITDGRGFMKLSQVHRDIRLPSLEKRFDERFSSFNERAEAAEEAAPAPPTSAGDQKREALLELSRTHGDLIMFRRLEQQKKEAGAELSAARYAARRATYGHNRAEARITEFEKRFDDTFKAVYDNPDKARTAFNAFAQGLKKQPTFLEKITALFTRKGASTDLGSALKRSLVPSELGSLKGYAFMGFKSADRKEAERQAKTLWRQYRGLLTTEARLNLKREEVALKNAALVDAEHTYQAAQRRLGSRKEQEQHRRTLFEARSRALARVTEQDIWRSDLPDDVKHELAAVWEERVQWQQVRQADAERHYQRYREPFDLWPERKVQQAEPSTPPSVPPAEEVEVSREPAPAVETEPQAAAQPEQPAPATKPGRYGAPLTEEEEARLRKFLPNLGKDKGKEEDRDIDLDR